ncbi:MAG: DUF1592 domain-containing protein [Planctomycetaceae bacterium]
MLRTAGVRQAGKYRVRVTGYAHQSTRPITFSVEGTTFARGAEHPTYGYFSMPPGAPTTIEMTTWIESGYMLQIEPYGISDRFEIKKVGLESYRGPGLAILQVELEGPLTDEFPSRGHELLFAGLNRAEVSPRNPAEREKKWYRPKFAIPEPVTRDTIRPALQRIATAAFRRPVDSSELTAYLDLFDSEVAAGASSEEALRSVTTAIFCSPDFLYLREAQGQLNDYALASRLSYFLTRSTPDAELLESAASGRLTGDASERRRQVERLLTGPHHDRFLADFTDAWLNLREIDFTTPDKQLFPEFDAFLQYSMVAETRSFLKQLIVENRPAVCLVKPDFAMLNHRLAEHYDIAGVDGPDLRPVPLPADSVRGGLLAQAAVLKVSANGTNTSPVVRGVWVMERILGEVPPPPPAGVGGVEPDIRGATTLRELLAKHRDVDSCRSCHTRIDPPGFAMENFNPIGGWRDRFRSLGEGTPVKKEIDGFKVRYKLGPEVDSSGELPDGRTFSGFSEFRDLLAADEDRLAKAFTTKLLTFATGRDSGFSDRAEINRIVAESKAHNHGLRNLFHLVVNSKIFLHK